MAVIKLVPRNSSIPSGYSVVNQHNMYSDTDSDQYCYISSPSSRNGTIWLYDFNTDDIPFSSIKEVNSITVKIKARNTGVTCNIAKNGTSTPSYGHVMVPNTVSVYTFDDVTLTIDDIDSLGPYLAISIPVYRSSYSTVRIYGAEILIDYTPLYNKVEYGDKTLIDLTADTVTPSSLLQGYTAHDNTGAAITGTAEIESHDDGDPLGYGTENTLRTVLYTDGTLIINEKSSDIEANVAKHGEATNTYPACDRSTTNNPYNLTSSSGQPWKNQKSSILNVELGSVVKPIYGTKYWFYGLTNCLSISMKGLDTSCIEVNFSMASMFSGCNALTSLDLGDKFDTSSVTDMGSMFSGCKALTSLDLGDKFDTSAVTDMGSMFSGCHALTSLDLGDKFDTSSVTDMSSMFRQGYVLTSLDLGDKFDTSSVTDMSSMFYNCNVLTSLDLGDKFDTSAVTSMASMFNKDYSLATIYTKLDFALYSETVQIFSGNTKLVGGNGTKYTDMANQANSVYARIDKSGTPGYFTDRSQKPVS